MVTHATATHRMRRPRPDLGALPPPLRGRVGEGGGCWIQNPMCTPLPVPPPQGGRERCGTAAPSGNARNRTQRGRT
jgi:hypothetical protein